LIVKFGANISPLSDFEANTSYMDLILRSVFNKFAVSSSSGFMQFIRTAFLSFLLILLISSCRSHNPNGLQKGRKLPKSGPIPCPVKDC
jgi:hypothetical protein